MYHSSPAPETQGASGMSRAEWLSRLARIGADHGFFQRVGARHLGLYVQESNTLLVTFDSVDRVFAQSPNGLPLGFAAVQRRDWSLLNIMSNGRTWFRDEHLADFFDGLAESGFFDSFVRVLFMGYGPVNGYAACAYSAAAPGAGVLVTNPAATARPDQAGFDRRFLSDRRADFSGRYGYAPAALAKAGEAVILHDPLDAESAAHVAQFTGDNTLRFPVRHGGAALESILDRNDAIVPILRALANRRLGYRRIGEMLRPARHSNAAYLWHLADVAQASGHPRRALTIARHGETHTGDDRFIELAAELGGTPMRDTGS